MATFYKNKNVVVTGGSGFVGTHFVKALLNEGAYVRVPIHRRPLAINHPSIEIVKADLTLQEDCRRTLKDADYVIHAAGAVSAAGVTTGANPMSAITTNLNLTAQILEASWAENIDRLLIFSSSTGYPATEHPVKENEMWTDAPLHPAYFGYGWMRRYLERMSEFVAQRSKTKIALIRPTATYGPHDNFDPKTSHVIPALIRRALAKETPFTVWGTGNEIRDFLYIEDLIRGCLLTLEKHAHCDPINIGYGKTTTIKEVVNTILKLSDHHDCPIEFDDSKPTTIKKRLVDTSKAKKLLNFQPNCSLESGLKQTIDWFAKTQRIPAHA